MFSPAGFIEIFLFPDLLRYDYFIIQVHTPILSCSSSTRSPSVLCLHVNATSWCHTSVISVIIWWITSPRCSRTKPVTSTVWCLHARATSDIMSFTNLRRFLLHPRSEWGMTDDLGYLDIRSSSCRTFCLQCVVTHMVGELLCRPRRYLYQRKSFLSTNGDFPLNFKCWRGWTCSRLIADSLWPDPP